MRMKKIQKICVMAILLLLLVGCAVNQEANEGGTRTQETANIMPTITPTVTPTITPMVTPTVIPTDIAFATTIADTTGLDRSKFTLDVTLNTKKHKLVVTQTLDYCNNTGSELSEIYFNLIPNAFQDKGGRVKVQKFQMGKEDVDLKKVETTVYKAKLPSSLASGGRQTIYMEYEVYIPNIQNRFGYQKSVYNLGNFIITPAIYGVDGWKVQNYVDIGDCFNSDIADYEVAIHVPEGYTVAASGKTEDNATYVLENVRDFAFCVSKNYETMTKDCDGVQVSIYYEKGYDKTAKRILEAANNSFTLLNELLGRYPYEALTVVMNGLTGGVNGMEYPTLIMVAPIETIEDLKKDGVAEDSPFRQETYNAIDMVTCHEIAHQWFYGIVGNDEVTEAWLDEGMCRFLEYKYHKAYLKPLPEDYGYDDSVESTLIYEDEFVTNAGKPGYAEDGACLLRSLQEWYKKDPMGYSEIYIKGAALLYQMQKQMGEEAFAEALKEYVSHFAYRFVTTDSFKEFWTRKCDFTELFEQYFKM